MEQKFKGKHFLTCEDWSKQELDTVFETSFDLKEKFKKKYRQDIYRIKHYS